MLEWDKKLGNKTDSIFPPPQMEVIEFAQYKVWIKGHQMDILESWMWTLPQKILGKLPTAFIWVFFSVTISSDVSDPVLVTHLGFSNRKTKQN